MLADNTLDLTTDPVGLRKAMSRLSNFLGQATEEGRAVLCSLRNSTVQKNDLIEQLQRVKGDCLTQSSANVVFSLIGETKPMHSSFHEEVYRIGSEAIRNACLHAEASKVEIELSYAEGFTLRVSDNGKGMDPGIAEKGRQGHFGLQGMKERAVRIGGKVSLITSTSAGTEITLHVPGGIFDEAVLRAGNKLTEGEANAMPPTRVARIRALLRRTLGVEPRSKF